MALGAAGFLALWCLTFLVVAGVVAGAASVLVVAATAAGAGLDAVVVAVVVAGAATAGAATAGAAGVAGTALVAGVACANEAIATPDNKLAAIRDLIFNMVNSLIKQQSHKLRPS